MRIFLVMAMMVCVWCLPASVLGGSSQVDLDGKGTSHLPQSGKDNLATGRKVQNMHRAKQGQKAMDNVSKQQRKNQAEMQKSLEYMNRNKINLPATDTMPANR